jgi:hypothetical protein
VDAIPFPRIHWPAVALSVHKTPDQIDISLLERLHFRNFSSVIPLSLLFLKPRPNAFDFERRQLFAFYVFVGISPIPRSISNKALMMAAASSALARRSKPVL